MQLCNHARSLGGEFWIETNSVHTGTSSPKLPHTSVLQHPQWQMASSPSTWTPPPPPHPRSHAKQKHSLTHGNWPAARFGRHTMYGESGMRMAHATAILHDLMHIWFACDAVPCSSWTWVLTPQRVQKNYAIKLCPACRTVVLSPLTVL